MGIRASTATLLNAVDHSLSFAEEHVVYSPVLPVNNTEIEATHQSAGLEDVTSPLTVRGDEKLQPKVQITENPLYYSLDKLDLPTGMCMHSNAYKENFVILQSIGIIV